MNPDRCAVFTSTTYFSYTLGGSWLMRTYDLASATPERMQDYNLEKNVDGN